MKLWRVPFPVRIAVAVAALLPLWLTGTLRSPFQAVGAQLEKGCSVAVLPQTLLTRWIKSQETVHKRPLWKRTNDSFDLLYLKRQCEKNIKMECVMISVVWRFKNKGQEGRASSLAVPPSLFPSTYLLMGHTHWDLHALEAAACSFQGTELCGLKRCSLFQIKGNKKLFLAGGLPQTHIKHGKRQTVTRREFTQ